MIVNSPIRLGTPAPSVAVRDASNGLAKTAQLTEFKLSNNPIHSDSQGFGDTAALRDSVLSSGSSNESRQSGGLQDAFGDNYNAQSGAIGNVLKPQWGSGWSPLLQNTIKEAIAQLGLEVELDDPGLLDDESNVVFADIDGEIFVDDASLTDVQQGHIGNCYLMAALASIAKHNPEFLEQMITDNGNGTYTVHFRGGALGDVTIDDDFPVYNWPWQSRFDDMAYAETNTGGGTPELWVAIIEKAYAQALGGYQQTVGGYTETALAQITGQDSFTTGAPASFTPQQLQAALDNNQSVTASSLTKDEAKKADLGTGIISNHAYVVTDVRQNTSGEWEVVVYNPWGSDKATGDGSNDGFTLLSMVEFYSNFRRVQIMNAPIALAA